MNRPEHLRRIERNITLYKLGLKGSPGNVDLLKNLKILEQVRDDIKATLSQKDDSCTADVEQK